MLSVSTAVKMAQIATMLPSFNGGAIGLYSGPRPPNAEAAAKGTLLGWVSNNGYPWTPGSYGAGLQFLQLGPYLTNDPSQSWACVPIASGTASWFRLYSNSASENFQTRSDLARIDGDIGALGTGSVAELQIPSTTIAMTAPFPISYFLYTIPPIP